MADTDKLATYALANLMKFIRNDGEPAAENVELESVELTDDEIELGFTFKRDRYYLRVRLADLRRLMESQP